MPDPSLIGLFVRPLNRLRIPYLVSGGVASVVYGEPRLTLDIALVVRLEPRDAARFASAWSPHDFYVPPIEVLDEESRRPAHGHFNLSHHETTLRADVYLAADDPLTGWAFERAVIREIEGEHVALAPIEAVIVNKLRYLKAGASDRHRRDISRMLRVSGDLVNLPDLERWVDRLGVEPEWRRALAYRDVDHPPI